MMIILILAGNLSFEYFMTICHLLFLLSSVESYFFLLLTCEPRSCTRISYLIICHPIESLTILCSIYIM